MSQTQRLLKMWGEALHAARSERQDEWEELHLRNLYGASKVGGCLRESYLSRKKTPVTNHPSDAKFIIFDIGHRIEAWYIDVFGKYVVENDLGYIDPQAEVANENHYAHTDGLWIDFDNSIATAIEVKSIHPDAIDNTERRNNGTWVAYPHHSLQISQFMYLAREQGGYVLPDGNRIPVNEQGLIFYISKDGRTRTSIIGLPDWETELVRRIKILDDAWATSVAPERQKDADAYPCAFGGSSTCQFWDWCWGTESPKTPKGSMAFLKTVGINVFRKNGCFVVNGKEYNGKEIVNMAVAKYDASRKK